MTSLDATSSSQCVSFHMVDTNTSCEDGIVRLRDGTDPSNGRIEICQYRTWGAVCSDQWNDTDASIVCGQLDYNPEGLYCV